MRFITWLIETLFSKVRKPGSLNKDQIGVFRDCPDKRDYIATMEEQVYLPIISTVTDNPYKYVKNQGQWNSCASHAMCTAMEISLEGTGKELELSEQHHYWWARQKGYMDNFPNNAGMYARTMLQVGQNIGLTPEKLAPYISTNMNKKPNVMAEGFANSNWWKINHYFRVLDIASMRSFIANGYPVLVGFYTNPSFIKFTGDIVATGIKYGGHEVVIYGYDDETEEMLCINSWGNSYKDNGCMRVPYEYFEKYGIDMWTFNT